MFSIYVFHLLLRHYFLILKNNRKEKENVIKKSNEKTIFSKLFIC